MTEIELINLLLEKSKDKKEGVFLQNELTYKISELKKFDKNVAEQLATTPAIIFSKSFGNGNKILRKDNFQKSLIQYSIEEDYITFFPSVLKAYLNET